MKCRFGLATFPDDETRHKPQGQQCYFRRRASLHNLVKAQLCPETVSAHEEEGHLPAGRQECETSSFEFDFNSVL